MLKKGLSVAALWLMLALLVLIYTDREEYTWAFSGETLSQVLITQEQAQQREDAAQAAMDAEKEEAYARGWSGKWGKKDQYDGAPKTRSAVDDELGLNLMWGEYEVQVTYDSIPALTLRTVSALRQPFIQEGTFICPAGGNTLSFSFTLTDSCEQVAFACDQDPGTRISSITVRKTDTGAFSRDLAAYALLFGGVLTVLLVLSWDQSARGAMRRRDALVVILTALFASMPLLWKGVYDGHDLFFHLNRIEGIAAGLRAGQLPVRIHASTLLGYGYAAPQFYPEFFLYIPAVLRNLGVSLAASVRVFEILINLATASVCYFCARSALGSRRIALGASMLYTLCSYRISNMYVRATLGESLAMIFFPLLLLAVYEVMVREERCWPLLALAMTGIFMSHLLSTLFAVGLCVVCALACVRRLIREPRRILACIKAALVMIVCSAEFLVPFLSYAGAGISTSVAVMAGEHVLRPGALFVGFPGMAPDLPYAATDFAYTVGVVPGLAIMLGCLLLLLRWYMADGEKGPQDRLCCALLLLGGVLMLLSTEAFPWAWLCDLPRPYSTFFQQIQYPWRLVGMAVPMLSLAGAWGYLREEKARTQGLVLIAALCAVLGGFAMQAFVQDVPLLTKEDFCDTRIEQYEYTYEMTEKGALEPGEIIALNAPEYTIRDYKKQGTNLSFTLDAPQGLASLEVPLLYYPGYHAQADGEPLRVSRGNNNVIRLYGIADTEDAHISVWYEEPVIWTVSAYVSLAGMAVMAFLLARMGKGRRA